MLDILYFVIREISSLTPQMVKLEKQHHKGAQLLNDTAIRVYYGKWHCIKQVLCCKFTKNKKNTLAHFFPHQLLSPVLAATAAHSASIATASSNLCPCSLLPCRCHSFSKISERLGGHKLYFSYNDVIFCIKQLLWWYLVVEPICSNISLISSVCGVPVLLVPLFCLQAPLLDMSPL